MQLRLRGPVNGTGKSSWQIFGGLIGTLIHKTHSWLSSARPRDLGSGIEEKPAINDLTSQIEEFRSRKDGWKGPDSLGPREPTIDGAKTFAKAVLADGKIEPPHIGLAAKQDRRLTLVTANRFSGSCGLSMTFVAAKSGRKQSPQAT